MRRGRQGQQPGWQGEDEGERNGAENGRHGVGARGRMG
ncbi:hypothetical protein BN940_07396 [Castellaniella defragrans 65Phen]|uniref:Uncharacterized protein n=1 Tax=Castellaniella defragrans (strain DSM 12143 / CCUG 39792 / 65Phen) TaxID=1437824 RepID=W8X3S3_CASD6|nr:hypothetical protein BN940_07396 [Castellaniella defragrans 65Phen]